MSPVQTIETDDGTITIETRDGVTTRSFTPKPGTQAANRDSLNGKVLQAIAALEQADTNWASLTNAQKDNATRLAVRAVAKLARLILDRSETD